MTCWNDRIELARQGWMSDLRLTTLGVSGRDRGTVACGFWAKAHYWSGWITEVHLHDHIVLDLGDDDAQDRIGALVANVRDACERARRDFADVIPGMAHRKDMNGRLELCENTLEKQYSHGRERIFFPTEDIAEGIEISPAHAPSFLDPLVGAARDGLHVEDSLNPFFGTPRLARYCENRNWGYRLRLAMRSSGDTKVSFRPRSLKSDYLQESMIHGLIDMSYHQIIAHFACYAPGGALHGATLNGLPPGEKSLKEDVAEHTKSITAPSPDV